MAAGLIHFVCFMGMQGGMEVRKEEGKRSNRARIESVIRQRGKRKRQPVCLHLCSLLVSLQYSSLPSATQELPYYCQSIDFVGLPFVDQQIVRFREIPLTESADEFLLRPTRTNSIAHLAWQEKPKFDTSN